MSKNKYKLKRITLVKNIALWIFGAESVKIMILVNEKIIFLLVSTRREPNVEIEINGI